MNALPMMNYVEHENERVEILKWNKSKNIEKKWQKQNLS